MREDCRPIEKNVLEMFPASKNFEERRSSLSELMTQEIQFESVSIAQGETQESIISNELDFVDYFENQIKNLREVTMRVKYYMDEIDQLGPRR